MKTGTSPKKMARTGGTHRNDTEKSAEAETGAKLKAEQNTKNQATKVRL